MCLLWGLPWLMEAWRQRPRGALGLGQGPRGAGPATQNPSEHPFPIKSSRSSCALRQQLHTFKPSAPVCQLTSPQVGFRRAHLGSTPGLPGGRLYFWKQRINNRREHFLPPLFRGLVLTFRNPDPTSQTLPRLTSSCPHGGGSLSPGGPAV